MRQRKIRIVPAKLPEKMTSVSYAPILRSTPAATASVETMLCLPASADFCRFVYSGGNMPENKTGGKT
jgi:hypothetical protein